MNRSSRILLPLALAGALSCATNHDLLAADELSVSYLLDYQRTGVPEGDTVTTFVPVTASAEPLVESDSIDTESIDAHITYGQVIVSAESTADGSSLTDDVGTASVTGKWSDDWTITAPGITAGSSGTITLTYALSASLSASAPGVNDESEANYEIAIAKDSTNVYSRLGVQDSEFGFSGDPATDFTTGEISFFYGTGFEIASSLSAYASSGSSFNGGPASAEVGTATLTLTGILVKRSDTGTAVGNASLVSASGTSYPVSPVPEPGAFFLVAFAAFAHCLRRQRRA